MRTSWWTARAARVRSSLGHRRDFVPYRLFHLTASDGPNKRTERLVAIDAACGEFDPYGFPSFPGNDALADMKSANVVPEAVDEARLTELAIARIRRIIFSNGFFRLRALEVNAKPLLRLYVPYWLGFTGSESDTHLRVLDAVRRRIEGPKVRGLLRVWLRG